jgi:hypothetical protein
MTAEDEEPALPGNRLRGNGNDDHREGALGLLGCLPAYLRLDEPVRI